MKRAYQDLHPCTDTDGPSSIYLKSSASTNKVNWANCVICQEDTKEKTVCPTNGRRHISGYQYVADNLTQFHELGYHFSDVDFCAFDNGSGIVETFQTHGAIWHKTCRDKISTRMVERAKQKQQTDVVTSSPAKTRRKVLQHERDCCFFCGEPAGTNVLHRVSTMEVDEKVRKKATLLKDQVLLQKLAPGDMIATDSVYHNKCLQLFYKRASKAETNTPSEPDCEMLRSIAFAELVSFIESFQHNDTTAPIFHMSSLTQMYKSRLEALGVATTSVHSTRLRQKLLDVCPMLQECSTGKGKDIKLIFKRDVEEAIQRATDHDSEALLIAQVAKIVRREMFQTTQDFVGSFDENSQEKSVPRALSALIAMILDGPGAVFKNSVFTEDTEIDQTQAALTLSQLIFFNSRKRLYTKTAQANHRSHSKSKETPVPVYLGLKIHAETRKKELVDCLYHLGLSISYDRVMSISTDVANTVCAKYEADGVVVPPGLTSNLFTVGMVDNIDHNPTSTTATDSFHGTSLSLAQQPAVSDPKAAHLKINPNLQGKRSVDTLPCTYTLVPQIERTKDAQIPTVFGPCKPDVSEKIAKINGLTIPAVSSLLIPHKT